MSNILPDYELIDSGAGERLERFGSKLLVRPSKFAVWSKRDGALSPGKKWRDADAQYVPKQGWRVLKGKGEEWELKTAYGVMTLSLQESGQIGIFPEHAQYLDEIHTHLAKLKETAQPKVLNLFAYTGLASLAAVSAGAQVVHVDLSKRVLEWAKQNFTRGGFNECRLIQEDAISYMYREQRRGNKFDVIICDPPSFSRVSAKNEWGLEEKLGELAHLVAALIAPHGTIYFTTHHYESGGHVLANLLRDILPQGFTCTVQDLLLAESGTARVLPSGFLVRAAVFSS